MLEQSPVCATLAAYDFHSIRPFYEEVLGLVLDREESWGLIFGEGPTRVIVYESQFAGTNRSTAATWNVNNIDACVEELRSKGIIFEHYNFPNTKWKGDIATVNGVKTAWLKDPNGNILNLSQTKNRSSSPVVFV